MNAPTFALQGLKSFQSITPRKPVYLIPNHPEARTLEQPVEQILGLINLRRNVPAETADATSELFKTVYFTQTNFALMKQRALIAAAMAAHRPITFVLPAFPAKSPNTQKVIAEKPDFGEVAALWRLNHFCHQIRRIYSPGARVIICSDGRVFSDLVDVSDDTVSTYSRGISEIISHFELTNLGVFNLEDVYKKLSFEDMRNKLIKEFADSIPKVRAHVIEDPDGRRMFSGIHRFLFEDKLVLSPELSRSRSREISKQKTYEVIQRSNAWSGLVEKYFPEALRFSIHPQPLYSNKIGISLLPSDNIWRTPWHSAPLLTDRGLILASSAEAASQNAELKEYFHAGKSYSYFSSAKAIEIKEIEFLNET